MSGGHWIHHVCEPRRLLLAWQSADLSGERTRFAVGELVKDGETCILRYVLTPDVQLAASLGYVGYPAFKLGEEHRSGVLEAFMRRLPPRTRPDFKRYKAQFSIDPLLEMSDFALLAYTEAKLPSDGFSVVNTLEDACGPCELMLEIAGYRHQLSKLSRLPEPFEELALEPEPSNPRDPNAVVVKAHGETIGYVNRLQTAPFLRWIAAGQVRAVLERINGNAQRPRAFMFVWVSGEPAKAAA